MLDSGVGGLSILREVRRLLPDEDILYFADQGHVPYGPRQLEEIRSFVRAITRFFLTHDAKAVIIACNAASAASLYHVREIFPETPFIGMEPAVKPAAERTQNGIIGVITTKATFQGELFASVIDRFAQGVQVETQVCPEFVTQVEAGELDTARTYEIVQNRLAPLLEANIDQLVLGCTHFPFLTPVLREVMGAAVEIVDPGPAIARQTNRILHDMRNVSEHHGLVSYYTSGEPDKFLEMVRRLIGEPVHTEQVIGVNWAAGEITVSSPAG
jgi:glutamate racemase